jgi:hypothetical protein
MTAVNFFKVATLPGSLQADAFYFVSNGSYAEGYVTNSAGVARSIGNSSMINALADARISTALSNQNIVEIAADITARNALGSASTRNLLILVTNATGDATVSSGAALYAYNAGNTTYTKVSEYESLDVTLAWANITGAPASAPSLIDDAVTKRHAHTNSAVLDLLGESSGALTYNGQAVAANWTTNNW